MPKRKRKKYETDREAGALAQTARHPANVEETQQAEVAPAQAETPEGQKPAVFCEKCQRPALPDPRGTHVCARCRSQRLA